jgi:hypothetical protein
MSESKIKRVMDIIQFNPEPNTDQIRDIMSHFECSEKTVYNAINKVKKLNAQGPPPPPPPLKTPPSFMPKKKRVIPRIPKNMGFIHFCKYHSFPLYNGLYRWQKDWFKTVWPWKYSLTLVSRDHGKSIDKSNLSQWAMTAKQSDILYLGWTSRRKQIAQFVYNFFLQRGELIIDKASSPYHFKTVYGTSFDTYSVKSKEILGMHEVGIMEREIIDENRYLEDFVRNIEKPLIMIIDDAIDSTFRKERHKEEDLEEFFLSTIVNINPDKLLVVGTKKFEDDFYQFIQDVYEEDMIVYKRTPFLDPSDKRYGKESDNPDNLLCPERWISDKHPDYDLYLDLLEKKKNGAKIKDFIPYEQTLVRKKDLKKKRKIAGEYWWGSEYMQDPHPITGEIWDKIYYQDLFSGTSKYDLACITIDRATTTNKKSDETGIVVFFREKEIHYKWIEDEDGKEMKVPTHNYLVTNDYTRKIRITDLVIKIDEIYKSFIKTYRRVIRLVIVVEKQGGGDDFITLAEDTGYRWAHLIIPVHNTRNKWDRIEDNLGSPIRDAEIIFLQSLETSKVVDQILHAPYPNMIDAVDALSNGHFECEKIPVRKRNSEERAEQLRHHREDVKGKKSWEDMIKAHTKSVRSVF